MPLLSNAFQPVGFPRPLRSPRPRRSPHLVAAIALALAAAAPAMAEDWPTWGHDATRNMASAEKGLPAAAVPGKPKEGETSIDPASSQNVKWVARLGAQCYGNPVVAGGRVYVGTNNATPRDPKFKGDFGVVMCFEESTGKFLWQLVTPKLAAGKAQDYPEVGICSSPAVDGDHVYVITNRCEVLCLDAAGMANGNDGPFKDEAKYAADIDNPKAQPIEPGPADGDILWRYDMRDELGVYPYQISSSAPLVVGDKLYVTTSNGVDWTRKHVPAPWAPALICLDKKTGKLLGRENSGISARTFNCNYSSPALGVVGGRPTLVFGGGDGFCYGFDPEPVAGSDGAPTLRELWRIDCNPPERHSKSGKPLAYKDADGPSEIISTPVIYKDHVYVSVGRDPDQTEDRPGALTCIGVSTSGAEAKASVAWRNDTIRRSTSTVSIADGLLYVADFGGKIYCMDADTGAPFWDHDTEAAVWGSTLVADGKVYGINESGEMTVLAAGKEKKPLGKIDFSTQMFSSPLAANGVLYVATGSNLFALKETKK